MRIIAMIGLPLSGKTTIARKACSHASRTILHLDTIRKAVHRGTMLRDKKSEEKTREAVEWIVQALDLSGNRTLIIDDYNLTRWHRDFVRSLGKEVAFYNCATSVEKCCERARLADDPGLQLLINEMAESWEPFSSEELEQQQKFSWLVEPLRALARDI